MSLPWFYRQDGIGTDNQLAIVGIGSIRIAVVRGTAEMQLIWDLMSEGISPTAGYQLTKSHLKSLSIELNLNEASSRNLSMRIKEKYELNLELLSLLHQATMDGRLRWQKAKREAHTEYVASIDKKNVCVIELVSPLVSDNDFAKDALARVYVGTAHCDFLSGTEGMYYVEEVLAVGQSDWRKKLQAEEIEVKRHIAILKDLLRQK